MHESVIDVLFYLFDDLLSEDTSFQADVETMADQLSEAGFSQEEIRRAMAWFMELSELSQHPLPKSLDAPVIRIFSTEESEYIDTAGQDYLLGLLRRRLIDNVALEKIIDRALALEEPLEGDILRWVTAMVVLNVYGQIEDMRAFGLEDPIWQVNMGILQ